MAKKTRDVRQYEIYTVRRTFKIKRGKGERESMEEVAIFDDNKLAEAYKSAREGIKSEDKNLISEIFEIQPRWVELEPEATHYNLPFNLKVADIKTKKK